MALKCKERTVRCCDHGQVGTSTYYSWASMKKRCLDVGDACYNEYGGAGITICTRWMDFKAFYEDMGDRPRGHTLNRIHGAKVYSKETCEWATYTVQAFDQGMKSHNTSGRTGVYWRKNRSRWIVRIWKNNIEYKGGSFKLFEDAVDAREKLEKELYGFSKT